MPPPSPSFVYVSAWLKRWHPAAFACALLNSQPMGFYAPAQIVRDARGARRAHPGHRCARDSDWDCTLEADPESKGGFALRLGLRQVQGLPEATATRIAAARPVRSLADLIRRAAIDRGAVERLAAADAFRSLGLDRRTALWEAAAVEAPAPLQGELFEPAANPPATTAGEETVLDYTATGLSLRHHPLALLRPVLQAEDLADTRVLNAAKRGAWISPAWLGAGAATPGQRQGRGLLHGRG
ncbi:hypothetical protein [Dankookia sp. P2]|uniref:helix-hairpin-helix domain-containing protein n=1 Tax=Dankookia sp. P2 TaxID=3423955 RepID=UPI003D675C6A